MKQICDNDKCFGCALCSSVCPNGAINMNDETGFYRPVINSNKCNGCNLCVKFCAANNSVNSHGNIAASTYAACSLDDERHFNCTSGGLATEISNVFIDRLNGVVAGCAWNENMTAYHRMVTEPCDLKYISKSKYVYSDMSECYGEITKYVKEGRKILFIGVPCQVFAVKKYFEYKKYDTEKLYTIDLLCHGGASPKVLKEHLKHVTNGKSVDNVTFRGGEYDCSFTAYLNDKVIYRKMQFMDEYFYSFMKRIIYSPCCYECPFANDKRIGDLTLGDFWGLGDDFREFDRTKGVNVLMVNNSEAGKELLELVKDKISIFPREHSEAVSGNDTLREPTQKPAGYEDFMRICNTDGLHTAIKRAFGNELNKNYRKYIIKEKIKKVMPAGLLSVYRKLKGR